MNIIQEIIERLKKEHGKNGCWKVLESYCNDYKINRTLDNFNRISAFLFGLEATDFITAEEHDRATLYILEEID